MIIKKYIDINKPLTEKQGKMLQNLAENPASPDSDCPELTIEELIQFKRILEDY